MRCKFFIFFISLSIVCFGQSQLDIYQEETSILKFFFQILTEQSEAGYVFFNKKPVCIHGYCSKDVFAVNSPIHKQAVALREGARIWEQIGNQNSNILIHIYENEDPNIPGYIHILVINIPLFQQTIKENLSIFQYVLGPCVTPQSLLNYLISKGQTFHSALKNDKVLIGEILGFGNINSLYVSRIENIQEAIEDTIPPFLRNESLVCEYDREFLPIKPSFGFKSLREESEELQGKINLSSEKLVSAKPEFIFGWLKDSKEGTQFVSELENTQKEIQKLLVSPLFLETMLEKLSEKKYITFPQKTFYFQFNKDELNKVMARGVWDSIQDYDFEYISYFIEGIEKPLIQNNEIDRMAWFSEYRREFIEAKENLKSADEFFQSLGKNNDFHEVVPDRLYTKTLKNGQKITEVIGPLVSLEYSIFTPWGHCIAHQSKVSINLKNTIPGFAQGVQGMRVGETREMFIHPSLAYGFDTSLDKCIYLKAVVTVHEIQENKGFRSCSKEIDLSFLADPKTLSLRDENYKKALFQKGSEIGDHLKKCKEIDLGLVAHYLKGFYSGKELFIPTTQDDQNLINKVHWNIYFGSDTK